MADSTGTVFEWERTAMDNGEMPADIPFPQKVLFIELRLLYHQHRTDLANIADELRRGVITQQEADSQKLASRARCVNEKKEFLEEYEKLCQCEDIGKEWKAILDRTETAVAEYKASRTLENADKLLAAVLGRK